MGISPSQNKTQLAGHTRLRLRQGAALPAQVDICVARSANIYAFVTTLQSIPAGFNAPNGAVVQGNFAVRYVLERAARHLPVQISHVIATLPLCIHAEATQCTENYIKIPINAVVLR